MTKKMIRFTAACLLVVFTAIPCFAQELMTTTMRDGVVVCPCDCLISCSVPVDITTQEGLGELKDCVSSTCDCDCVPNGE